jgi:hypothetical protein
MKSNGALNILTTVLLSWLGEPDQYLTYIDFLQIKSTIMLKVL